MEQRVGKVENWLFYFMGGFALSSSLSIAAGNIFLSLGLLALLYRLYLKHDDLGRILRFDSVLTASFAALLGITLLSAMFSGDAVWGLRLFSDYYGYRMLGFYIVLIAVRDRSRLWRLVQLTAASILLNNVYTIWMGVQHLSKMDRPSGFMSYMAQAGILSAAVPIFVLACIRYQGRWRNYMLGAVVLSVAALLYNGTRGAWVAAAITAPLVAFFAVESKKKFLAGCLLAVLGIGVCFAVVPRLQHLAMTFTQADYQSNSERRLMWTSAFHMFQDHPLLGVGFGQYEHAYQTQYILPEAKERELGHAHSNVMQMLGERGALGCAAFCFMWVYFMYFALRGWLRYKDAAYLAFFAVVLGVMLQGLTEYNMGTTVVSKFYWFALAVGLQWFRLKEEETGK